MKKALTLAAVSLLCLSMIVFPERLVWAEPVFSDEFTMSVDARWNWIDPGLDCSNSSTAHPGYFRISVPHGGNDLYHYSNHDAPRLVQTASGDFMIETKILFDPKYSSQGAGILVWQDADNFLRLDRLVHGSPAPRQCVDVSGERGDTWYYWGEAAYFSTITYLRLERTGDTFTAKYSSDGSNWMVLTSVLFPFGGSVSIGIFVINEWQDNPISADFDYFRVGPEMPQGDFSILSVQPLQTVFDSSAELVAGRATAFRIGVWSTFLEDKRIPIKVTAGGKTAVKEYVIPKNTVTLIYAYSDVESVFFPTGILFSGVVELNPEPRTITESDYANNAKAFSKSLVATSNLKCIYMPFGFSGENLPTLGAAYTMQQGSDAFLKALFPIAQKEYRSAVGDPYEVTATNVPALDVLLAAKAFDLACELLGPSGKNLKVVLVVPDYGDDRLHNWFSLWWITPFTPVSGLHYSGLQHTVLVADRFWDVVPHEIGHTYAVSHDDKVNDKGDQCWVWPTQSPLKFGGTDTKYFGQSMICVMSDYVGGNRERLDLGWISDTCYKNMLNAMKTSVDPKVIVVSGLAFENGTVDLDPCYCVDEGVLDVPLGSDGNFTLRYRNSLGETIGQTGFNATFLNEHGPMNVTAFCLTVPYVADVAQIDLVFNGTTVASRAISPSSPQVDLTYPNGGEDFDSGDNVTISWSGSDLDDDSLSYSVMYTFDNGTTWFPIKSGVAQTSLNWTIPNEYPADQYRIKVIASDGFNTGADSSTDTFTVSRHDIAVTDAVATRTVVGKGSTLSISTAVQNRGNYTEEFNVFLYANSTIANQTQVILASGDFTTINLDWNTSGFAYGDYILKAVADPVLGEMDMTDNNCTAGWILISIPGDIAEPYRLVDIFDVVSITGIYESELGDPEYRPNSDIDGNGIVDIFDVVACTSHYEESW